MISGIYWIFNIVTGMFYIGSAYNFALRWKNHKIELRLNRHCNPYLQSAWNKYGEKAFIFEVVEYCEKENNIKREQSWIDITGCYFREIGYNLCHVVGSNLGTKTSAKTKALLSAMRKGKPRSEETKRRIGEGHKGKKVSEETRLKQSLAHIGHKHPEEFKQKMSKRLKGNQFNKGRIQTNAHKEAIRKSRIGHETSEETRKKIGAAHKGRTHSAETLLKMSLAAQRRWSLQKSVAANDGTLDYTSDVWV